MAESLLTTQDSLSCPICLDLLKDPVTIPCGHSYCLDCIKGCWNQNYQMGVYSCPQCRQSFTPRPVLNKNTMLAELAEGLRKTRLQAAPAADSFAGPGDVECDVCTGRKHKALKSCLVCLASYCETHIKSHYESPALKKHILIEASRDLKGKVCSHHHKLLEIFCHTDQKFICYLCAMDEHGGHWTVSAAAERNEKQKQMLETQREFHKRIQKREKELQDLSRSVNSLRRSAQAAVENSEMIFTELILSIERKRSEVKERIRAQEKEELSLAEELQKKLEQEIADLRRRDTELEQLSHTEDHIHFLQSVQSLSFTAGAADLGFSRTAINPHISTEELNKAVSEVKKQVEKLDTQLLVKISGVNKQPLPSPEPNTRTDFLKYSCRLTFDPNTAHTQLRLSEGNRRVTFDRQLHVYPDHPERFHVFQQVLCRESLSGRSYWEVEVSFLNPPFMHFFVSNFAIAVCYKDISRKGVSDMCRFGCNDQSWSLICCGSKLSFLHNNVVTELPLVLSSRAIRIGVYVDHGAGILSFYNISNTMTLLHTVHTTFTKPLYAGFQIYGFDNYIKISDLN